MEGRSEYSEEQRREALDIYREHGAAEAARRTGVAAGTIRQWAHRRGLTDQRRAQAKAGVEAAKLTWAQRRGEVVTRAGEAAAGFLDRAIEAKPRDARDLMASYKMASESAQLLDGAATERVEISETERLERVRELRDELAARRSKAIG